MSDPKDRPDEAADGERSPGSAPTALLPMECDPTVGSDDAPVGAAQPPSGQPGEGAGESSPGAKSGHLVDDETTADLTETSGAWDVEPEDEPPTTRPRYEPEPATADVPTLLGSWNAVTARHLARRSEPVPESVTNVHTPSAPAASDDDEPSPAAVRPLGRLGGDQGGIGLALDYARPPAERPSAPGREPELSDDSLGVVVDDRDTPESELPPPLPPTGLGDGASGLSEAAKLEAWLVAEGGLDALDGSDGSPATLDLAASDDPGPPQTDALDDDAPYTMGLGLPFHAAAPLPFLTRGGIALADGSPPSSAPHTPVLTDYRDLGWALPFDATGPLTPVPRTSAADDDALPFERDQPVAGPLPFVDPAPGAARSAPRMEDDTSERPSDAPRTVAFRAAAPAEPLPFGQWFGGEALEVPEGRLPVPNPIVDGAPTREPVVEVAEPVEPEPEPDAVEPIPFTTYAEVKVALWDDGLDLAEALDRAGIDETQWRANEARQAEAIAVEAREGKVKTAAAVSAAIRALRQQRAEPTEDDEVLELETYARLRVALAQDEVDDLEVLADEGLSRSDWTLHHGDWTRRARRDPQVAKELRRALARARRARRQLSEVRSDAP